MTNPRRFAPLAFVFAAGLAAGAFAAKKFTVSPAAFAGKEPKAAAEELLGAARTLAESGSYENLAVARLYYRVGRKAEGQEIIDRVMVGKTKAGDIVRVARIYREAGDWAKAKPLYDSVVQMAPEDEDWLAEVGAEYLLAGDRARAEELFAASLRLDPSNLYNSLRMAGAYLGVRTD
jgi:tetratricopeptide (TPR) repeat protein